MWYFLFKLAEMKLKADVKGTREIKRDFEWIFFFSSTSALRHNVVSSQGILTKISIQGLLYISQEPIPNDCISFPVIKSLVR